MRKLRDVFYVYANVTEGYVEYYGMEFAEFLRFCPVPIENILVTKPWLIDSRSNNYWLLGTYNGKQEIKALSNQFLYSLGDFNWIDYSNDEALNSFSEYEKAEVLYLSHFGKPLVSPFFPKISNNFAYLSHDDGWYCKLYVRDISVFGDIIANKIIAHFSSDKRRKIASMGDSVKIQLLELAEQGLFIDFDRSSQRGGNCKLSLEKIGKYDNMDAMYHRWDKRMEIFSESIWLNHKNKKWEYHHEE